MTMWHDHEDHFVGKHTHAIGDVKRIPHRHTEDGVVEAADARWKRPKGPTGDAVALDVQSSTIGQRSRS